jgi:putative oxidoreductase
MTSTSSTQANPTLALVGRILLALMFVGAGIVLELVGGLALIVGWQTRWAALALAFFTLAASVIFHNFWAMPAEQQMVQQLMFMKNISVAGGMLVLAAFGAGAFSVDARHHSA